jgi:hypothetical protein
MADIIIDNQVAPSTPGSGAHVLFADSGTKKLTQKDDTGRLWTPGSNSRNWSTAAQSPAAATDTYLTNSDLLIPSYTVQVGTRLIWEISASKTAASTAAPVWTIRSGANRTTGDTSRLAATGVAQTAAADVGVFTLMGVFRVVGASAVLQMTVLLTHNLGTATGFGGTSEHTSGAFDSTAINGTYFGVSLNTGTAGAWTITQVHGRMEM